LMRLDEADIEFRELPSEWHATLAATLSTGEPQFRLVCPGCQHSKEAPGKFLGQKVRCPKCKQDFLAEWGEVA
jgi:transposase-like protein